jgi:hypothetical protein
VAAIARPRAHGQILCPRYCARLMPQSVRTLLCWLLAVLVLGQGLPSQRTADCGAGDAGCAVATSCCCPVIDDGTADELADEAERCCDCAPPQREPQPAPEPSSPKSSLPLCESEPARAPPCARVVPHTARDRTAACLPRAHSPLPHVARQIAYSVWRL